MHVSTLFFFIFSLFFILLTINATSDIRQRFHGLVGKSVQVAWRKIDKEGLNSIAKNFNKFIVFI